jgi:hypothetical protein
MKIRVKYIIVLVFSVLVANSVAQKKKEIKKFGIRTVTSTKTQGNKILKDEKQTFNSSGLLIEEIKYDDEGAQSSLTRYKYNADEDIIEETEYDEKNILLEKRVMKYNALAQKIEERVTGKDGRQIKRFTYTYDAKGLRNEKKTYDAANVLVITKKIVYGYN